MSRLTRDGTAEPISRGQILRLERGQRNIYFLCSADHVQDWKLYPVDPYSCYMCDHIHDQQYNLVGGKPTVILDTYIIINCHARTLQHKQGTTESGLIKMIKLRNVADLNI